MKVRLTRKLTLEARTRSVDGAGGFSGDWTVVGTHWGALEARFGRLERGEEMARTRAGYRITVRAVPQNSEARPSAGQRFRDGTRVFAIRAVTDATSDARYLICHVDEESAS